MKTEEELESLARAYADNKNNCWINESAFKAGYRAAEKQIFETNRDRFGKCIARTFRAEGAGDQWWIPQCEVEKLESKLNIALEAEKKRAERYREALEFYASKTTEVLVGNPNIGDRAREALKD